MKLALLSCLFFTLGLTQHWLIETDNAGEDDTSGTDTDHGDYQNQGTDTDHGDYQNQDCRCGIAQRKARIIGGRETEVNEYPWQVWLAIKAGRMWQFTCGGSVINNRWILTAGHCFEDKWKLNPKIWKVHLGDHDRTSKTETNDVVSKVSRIVRHPKFEFKLEGGKIRYDFTLLKLKKKIDFAMHPNIRPICLPLNDENTYAGKSAIATGWGLTKNPGYRQDPSNLSNKLLELKLKMITNEECVEEAGYGKKLITPRMICAHGDGHKATCNGDSGGPLITRESSSENYELIGVSSFVADIMRQCAVKKPIVFARVSKMLKWITDTTKKGSKSCPR